MEVRPRLLTGKLRREFLPLSDTLPVYEPSLDQAGHEAGPDSELVRVSLCALALSVRLKSLTQMTLKAVDEFARQVHDVIVQRNLTSIVDVIFVSDHGMTDTSNVQLVYLDDILGDDGVNAIEHEDGTWAICAFYAVASFNNARPGWPSVGLRFREGTNSTKYLELLEAAASNQPGFGVYTHETMPKRWYFAKTPRIAPIYVVPHIGWAIINRHDHEEKMSGTYSPKGVRRSYFVESLAHLSVSALLESRL